jgi:WD40-like Beta Propeller Repeat
MANGDLRTRNSADRAAKVDQYVTTVAAVATVLFGIIDRFQPSSLPLSLAITALFLTFLAIAVLRSRRRREHLSALTITVGLLGAVVAIASWLGLLAAESATGPDESEPSDMSTASTLTQIDESPAVEIPTELLCVPAGSAADNWFLYETAGVERMITIEPDEDEAWAIPGGAFAAAGQHIVYTDVADARRIEIMDLTTREVVASTALSGRATDATISEDGDHVVAVEDSSGDTRLVLWRPSTDEVTVLHDPLVDVSAPALSPSGDQLAWVLGANRSGRLVVADVATLGERVVAQDGGDPAWSPDGSTLVYSAPHGEGRAIHAVPVIGGESYRITSPVRADDYDPAVLPTCDGVVYARAEGGTVDLWETRLGRADERLRPLAGAQSRPAFARS